MLRTYYRWHLNADAGWYLNHSWYKGWTTGWHLKGCWGWVREQELSWYWGVG
jgi:hypothetical protein